MCGPRKWPTSLAAAVFFCSLAFVARAQDAANSCSGCHNLPSTGDGGDRVANVFVLGQRFDFMSFNHADALATAGALDERGSFVTQQTFANERKTIGMNGSGFIEMLARQMTADLQAIRDSIPPGTSKTLVPREFSFQPLHAPRQIHHHARSHPRPLWQGPRLAPTFHIAQPQQQDCIIEFVKTLEVLSTGAITLVEDESGRARNSD
jgi:hypothetical protein